MALIKSDIYINDEEDINDTLFFELMSLRESIEEHIQVYMLFNMM